MMKKYMNILFRIEILLLSWEIYIIIYIVLPFPAELRNKSERKNVSLGSRAVDGKRFIEWNASSIRGNYFRLG